MLIGGFLAKVGDTTASAAIEGVAHVVKQLGS
jgi:hypothetical protein